VSRPDSNMLAGTPLMSRQTSGLPRRASVALSRRRGRGRGGRERPQARAGGRPPRAMALQEERRRQPRHADDGLVGGFSPPRSPRPALAPKGAAIDHRRGWKQLLPSRRRRRRRRVMRLPAAVRLLGAVPLLWRRAVVARCWRAAVCGGVEVVAPDARHAVRSVGAEA